MRDQPGKNVGPYRRKCQPITLGGALDCVVITSPSRITAGRTCQPLQNQCTNQHRRGVLLALTYKDTGAAIGAGGGIGAGTATPLDSALSPRCLVPPPPRRGCERRLLLPLLLLASVPAARGVATGAAAGAASVPLSLPLPPPPRRPPEGLLPPLFFCCCLWFFPPAPFSPAAAAGGPTGPGAAPLLP